MSVGGSGQRFPHWFKPNYIALRVAYFVHDLNDAAVGKRLAMLRAAGLDAIVTGFWRERPPPAEISDAPVVPLSRTFDGRFAQRGWSVLRHAVLPGRLLRALGSADVFLARSLEMLALAAAVKRRTGGASALVYEALDIHRLLLSSGVAGTMLRATERALIAEADLLIASSPAFLREYFEPVQFRRRPAASLLLENKVLQLRAGFEERGPDHLASGPPWRIGWFGMIRCRHSFEMLSSLAKRRPDLVQVEIAGRPAATIFNDFAAQLPSGPGMRFAGPYAPCDLGALGALYQSVHFNWAIDYFEEGGNSQWLLPNRIYEGGSYDVVPLARGQTETGRWLNSKHLGVVLEDPAFELEPFLESLTERRYQTLKSAARSVPRSAFIADQADCDRLASVLARTARVQLPAVGARQAGPAACAPKASAKGSVEIDVCICTYRRPQIVETLRSLSSQTGLEPHRMRIVVADNSLQAEARIAVLRLSDELGLNVTYVHAPANNISIARNACLDAARGHWIAFLDDDEIAESTWLSSLVDEAQCGNWDAVLGPVDAIYPDETPRWMSRGNFHSTRPVWRRGRITTGYTGNVLLRRALLEKYHLRFRNELGSTGGEDDDFFDRFADAGGRIGFAPGAAVREHVEAARASLAWLMRRSFRAGQSHGVRLKRQRRSVANGVVAFAKAGACIAGAVVSATSAIRRTRYLIRAAMHCGAVARLMGVGEIEIRMY